MFPNVGYTLQQLFLLSIMHAPIELSSSPTAWRANGLRVWSGPAYTPDLNLIENLWAARRAAGKRFPPSATLTELQTDLQEEWQLLISVAIN